MTESPATTVPVVNTTTCDTTVVDTARIVVIQIRMGLAIPSVIGNCLSFAVMTMKKNRCLTSCFLMANLAIVDTIPLLAFLHDYLSTARLHDTNTRPFYCQLGVFLGNLGVTSAAWIVFLMTAERCVAILMPLKVSQICTMRNARISVLVVYVVVSIRHIHSFFFFTTTFDADSGWYSCVFVEGYDNVMVADRIFKLAFDSLGPCVLIFIANILIIMSLRKRQQANLGATSSGATDKRTYSQQQITRTLLFVSITFSVLVTPHTVRTFLQAVNPAPPASCNSTSYNKDSIIDKVLHGLLYVNHGINFFLYCIGGGKRFRNDVAAVLKCKRN
ncbi:putative G-protein coupled receptor 139 [Tubulanus polymorphus]|uniref:putative G-protein coupled receptor 139 n=1 Tax=Tubulanus polymorphus TaxID=672921 RepID=UPI003DA48271